jgi:hypothetical protein
MFNTFKDFVAVDADGSILWVATKRGVRENYDLLTDRDGVYVRAWTRDNLNTWQVCAGGARHGSTLIWQGATTEERAANFARHIGAHYYKTVGGFERAIARSLEDVS